MPNQQYQPSKPALLETRDVCIRTPEGRLLFNDLNMAIGHEKIAVIGRNGVGKTTFLEHLAGKTKPNSGLIQYRIPPHMVPQKISINNNSLLKTLLTLTSAQVLTRELHQAGLPTLFELQRSSGYSHGEARKLYLLIAKLNKPNMLLLDEPTEDLDDMGFSWLSDWLASWTSGLLVVSHDRELLSQFEHFFIIQESGCTCFSGSFDELDRTLENAAEQSQFRYLQKLRLLNQKETRQFHINRRRQRKKIMDVSANWKDAPPGPASIKKEVLPNKAKARPQKQAKVELTQ